MTSSIKLSLVSGAVLALALGAWLYVSYAEQEARYLAIAEERERQAQVQEAERQKLEAAAKAERDQHEAERAQWAEQQASLARSLAARNQSVDNLIAAALAPKTQEQVADDAKKVLGLAAPAADGGFKLTLTEMQDYVALKLDRDRLAENLKETERQLVIERQASVSLRADLDKVIELIKQANRSIDEYQTAMEAYKKVAKRSKWRKILNTGKTVGLTFATAYLATRLAR